MKMRLWKKRKPLRRLRSKPTVLAVGEGALWEYGPLWRLHDLVLGRDISWDPCYNPLEKKER